MRQAIARRMSESKGPVPQFYLTTAVDMGAALALVNSLNDAGKEEDLRVSPMTLVIKACAYALAKFPNLNASFAGDKIAYHDAVHIGVAVGDVNRAAPIVGPAWGYRNRARLSASRMARSSSSRQNEILLAET